MERPTIWLGYQLFWSSSTGKSGPERLLALAVESGDRGSPSARRFFTSSSASPRIAAALAATAPWSNSTALARRRHLRSGQVFQRVRQLHVRIHEPPHWNSNSFAVSFACRRAVPNCCSNVFGSGQPVGIHRLEEPFFRHRPQFGFRLSDQRRALTRSPRLPPRGPLRRPPPPCGRCRRPCVPPRGRVRKHLGRLHAHEVTPLKMSWVAFNPRSTTGWFRAKTQHHVFRCRGVKRRRRHRWVGMSMKWLKSTLQSLAATPWRAIL